MNNIKMNKMVNHVYFVDSKAQRYSNAKVMGSIPGEYMNWKNA